MKKFILGMLTISLFIPIIDSITNLICSWLEVFKIYPTKKIIIENDELENLQSRLQKYDDTNVIGFQYNPQDECYEYDDYEEDRK